MMIQNANGIWMLEGEQLWDTEILPVCLEHIKEGDTVIDAGAWIGGHTMAYAKKVGETGRVYAFEPNIYAYECLKKNVGPLSTGNLYIYPMVLGDKHEFVSFSFQKGWQDSGHIGEDQKVGEVSMRRLDGFHITPNFIKIDVEGCELKVLKGAAKTIEKHRPKMVIEINKPALERQGNSQPEVYEWLWKNGYDFTLIEQNANLHAPIYNILCTPK